MPALSMQVVRRRCSLHIIHVGDRPRSEPKEPVGVQFSSGLGIDDWSIARDRRLFRSIVTAPRVDAWKLPPPEIHSHIDTEPISQAAQESEEGDVEFLSGGGVVVTL
mmetsp:Transcript_53543/g.125338  ORF Transcript_53543/g.125338 Transcript_53543/m.125338 type:complete len:107 (+) Transcript_53543:3049-3369(+)